MNIGFYMRIDYYNIDLVIVTINIVHFNRALSNFLFLFPEYFSFFRGFVFFSWREGRFSVAWRTGNKNKNWNALTVTYSKIPTPASSNKFSLHIYTDLHSPGSWKKVRNQSKVWKFYLNKIYCPWYCVLGTSCLRLYHFATQAPQSQS